MKAERILRQMCLLVAFLMLDAEGILRLTEGKTFPKVSVFFSISERLKNVAVCSFFIKKALKTNLSQERRQDYQTMSS